MSLGRRKGVDSFYIQGHQKKSQRKQEDWEEAALGKRVVCFGIVVYLDFCHQLSMKRLQCLRMNLRGFVKSDLWHAHFAKEVVP